MLWLRLRPSRACDKWRVTDGLQLSGVVTITILLHRDRVRVGVRVKFSLIIRVSSQGFLIIFLCDLVRDRGRYRDGEMLRIRWERVVICRDHRCCVGSLGDKIQKTSNQAYQKLRI